LLWAVHVVCTAPSRTARTLCGGVDCWGFQEAPVLLTGLEDDRLDITACGVQSLFLAEWPCVD
jgi:hypothetical protein